MAKLIYSGFTSLDGFMTDEAGAFEWAELDEEVFAFINDRERPVGTYLLGRKMYETMAVWETPDVIPDPSPGMLAYTPIWRAAEKVVYSTKLQSVSARKTRLERRFDADAVRKLKAEATRDLAIGGPGLAARAIAAGLVDEFNMLVAPVVAGGGLPYLPRNMPLKLELTDERRFKNGLVHLRYRTRP